MLPEIGATELLVIAIVALIVVGPKDLPLMLRKLGQFMAKLRGMAAEFRASFDEMARQSELDELRKEVEAMRRGQFGAEQAAAEATQAQVRQVFDDIGDSLSAGGVQFPPTTVRQDDAEPSTPEPAAEPKPKARRAPAKKAEAAKAPAKKTPAKSGTAKARAPKSKTAKAGAKA